MFRNRKSLNTEYKAKLPGPGINDKGSISQNRGDHHRRDLRQTYTSATSEALGASLAPTELISGTSVRFDSGVRTKCEWLQWSLAASLIDLLHSVEVSRDELRQKTLPRQLPLPSAGHVSPPASDCVVAMLCDGHFMMTSACECLRNSIGGRTDSYSAPTGASLC